MLSVVVLSVVASLLTSLVLERSSDVLDETNDRLGRIGHPKVRPGGEVEVGHRAPCRVGLGI
jgi:hypothetical protein